MEEKNKKEKLYIPLNVRKRKEIFAGFGKSEAVITALVVLISFIIALIYYSFSRKLEIMVIIPIISGILAVISLVKDQTNTNLIDSIVRLYQFTKSQKIYQYKYYNIYEKEYESEGLNSEEKEGSSRSKNTDSK